MLDSKSAISCFAEEEHLDSLSRSAAARVIAPANPFKDLGHLF
jgi:hypothetical protein